MAVYSDFLGQAQKGLVELSIIDRSTDPYTILAIPKASGGVYQTGAENGEIEEINCRGERVRGKVYKSVSKPTFQVDIGARTPSAVALRLNQKMASTSGTITVHRNKFVVPSTGTYAAVASGYLGYGVSADPTTAYGSYMDEYGLTKALTYDNDYAGFSASGTTSFAIGASGAMKFTNDLKDKQISFAYDYTGTFFETGALSYSQIALYARTVSIDQYVTEWIASDVSVDATGDVSLVEPAQQISFFVNGDVKYRSLGLLNQC